MKLLNFLSELSKEQRAFGVVIIAISVILSISIQSFYRTKIKTVDLGKILNAQVMLANKASSHGTLTKPWMATVKDAGQKLRAAIYSVAGRRSVVIVSPAVVKGAPDITNQVLQKLGLPTKVPGSVVPIGAVFGSFKFKGANKNVPKWMAP